MPRSSIPRRRKRAKKPTHWFFRWPTLVVLVLLGVFVTRGVVDMAFKYRRAVASTEIAQQEYEELQQRKNELENRIERLNTDTGFEAELRRKYSVSREGEQIVQLVGEEESIDDPAIQEDKKSWWQKIKELVTGTHEYSS